MTFYQREVHRIRKICYANEAQIATVIGLRRFMDEQYAKALELDQLSKQHFTSKFHLLRLFKRYYGQTPMQYLTDKRMEQSKWHLKNGYTVAATCYAIGFESPASFSTLFRRKFGKSPTQFQKAQFSQHGSAAGAGTLPTQTKQ